MSDSALEVVATLFPDPSLAARDGLRHDAASTGTSSPTSAAPAIALNTTETVTLAGSNLVFNNTYGAGVTQDYITAILIAENNYQLQISTAATLNFTFNMGNIGDAVASNDFSVYRVGYSALVQGLSAHETPMTAAAMLRNSAQLSGSTFDVPENLALALGLPGARANSMVTVTLNQNYQYFYNTVVAGSGSYDAVSALEHEISEGGFGRVGGDTTNGSLTHSVLDLFRYSAPGQLDPSLGRDGSPAYFSADGVTLSTQFHNPVDAAGQSDGGDSADWRDRIYAGPYQYDSNGAASADEVGVVTKTDLSVLTALGWSPTPTLVVQTVSSGQTLTVSANQAVQDDTVLGGGVILVLQGGSASGTVMNGGEIQVEGSAALTQLNSGLEVVQSGGAASYSQVGVGATQFVSSAGSADSTVVVGGAQIIDTGASAGGTVVSSGDLYEAGDVSLVNLEGGVEFVLAGGQSLNTTISAAGAQVVSSQGSASFARVIGGLQLVFGGGVSFGTLLSSGNVYVAGLTTAEEDVQGDEFILAGGTAKRSRVDAGSVQVVSSGGVASGTLISGGVQLVFGGGATSGAVLNEGQVYVSGTTLSANDIAGYEFILPGGTSISGTVGGLAIEVISSGATAAGMTIAGGVALVFGGGVDTATTISSGQAYVSGVSLSTTIVGGDEFILPGGSAFGTTVAGGFEVISSGGATTSAVISSGGGLIVYAGGDIGASLTLAGGIAYLAEAVTASSTVTFSGAGGHLVLDDPTTFAGRIAGLNLPSQGVDLSGFAYGSGETASWTQAADNTSGTLTVTDGARIATLNLLGSYVTGNFTLSDDGGGGTLVVDPPAPAFKPAAHTLMAQAMAGMVSAGGTLESHHDWSRRQDLAAGATAMVTPTSGIA